jgi:hypothetical protein
MGVGTSPYPTAPTGSAATFLQVPSKVHRHTLAHPVYKIRSCRDNRVYDVVPFTVAGPIAVGDYGPMWRADRDYWIARATVNIGTHNDNTHPLDGCPTGSAAKFNFIRVIAGDPNWTAPTNDSVLNSDQRLVVNPNHHQDAINDAEDGAVTTDDFNIHHLEEGEHVFLRILAVGSSVPGIRAVASLTLIPIP